MPIFSCAWLVDELIGYPPNDPALKNKPKHRPRNRNATTAPEYLAAEIRRETAATLKIELQNAAARRELLPAKAVEAEWAAILRDVRAAMLVLPSRLQQQLPHLSAHDLTTIDWEIRDALKGALRSIQLKTR